MCTSIAKCHNRRMVLSTFHHAAFNLPTNPITCTLLNSSSSSILCPYVQPVSPFSSSYVLATKTMTTTARQFRLPSIRPIRSIPSNSSSSSSSSSIPPSGNNGSNIPSDSNPLNLDRGLFASNPELERLAMKSTDAPILSRIVTYNVLSSSLAGASHFPECKPSNLDSTTRLRRVLAKLEVPVASRSIICLQEVSLSWSGHLHSFFSNRGFHFVLASHGSYFNGYMGEGVAFPMDLYEAVDIKIERLSDTMQWPDINNNKRSDLQKSSFPNRLKKAWDILFPCNNNSSSSSSSITKKQKSSNSTNNNNNNNNNNSNNRPKREPWEHARGRHNRFIFVRLRSRTNGARFCVGTYHMPCIYWSPPVMMIHAGLVVRNFQRLCGNDQGILAGDFNIKPGDATYQMILDGSIDTTHPDFPATCPDGTSPSQWFPMPLAPMKSAYREILGTEPDFTNYAKVEENPTFIETLDYVFCTRHVDVVDVMSLPHRNEVIGPFPDAREPSDHIMIGVTIRLPAPERRFRGSAYSYPSESSTPTPSSDVSTKGT